MVKIFFLQSITFVLIKASPHISKNTLQCKCSKDLYSSNTSINYEDKAMYEKTTKLDFYSISFAQKLAKQKSVVFDFSSFENSVNSTKHEEIVKDNPLYENQDQECYKCYKSYGKNIFIQLFKNTVKHDVKYNLKAFKFANNDIFKVFHSEIIEPLKDELIYHELNNKKEKMIGAVDLRCSNPQTPAGQSKNMQAEKVMILKAIFDLLSALIFSYNFEQKMNSYLIQDDFIDFLDESNLIKKDCPAYKTLNQYKEKTWEVEDVLNNGMVDKAPELLLKACVQTPEFKNVRKAINTAQDKTRQEIITKIYSLIKKFAAHKQTFTKVCNAVNQYSDEAYKKTVNSINGFTLFEFEQSIIRCFCESKKLTSSVFYKECSFLRSLVCRIHPFMLIMKNINDINESMPLCQKLRQLNIELTQYIKTSDINTVKVYFVQPDETKYIVERPSKPDGFYLKQRIASIVMSYLVTSMKIKDETRNLESYLNQSAIRILTEVARFLYLTLRPTNFKIPKYEGNGFLQISGFCNALSEKIFDEIQKKHSNKTFI